MGLTIDVIGETVIHRLAERGHLSVYVSSEGKSQ